ncbi:TetR/AcrR family transcriptional regulator [Nocardia blacklockiae]|uniref:TetR/AcrR family transcriptional regulator n=1 Tax=Nocardia blacklockiae TaxID=480036 RepID=UPI001894EA37|nr:TetR/AcrR family transcriptional regulator [Nocardia blacklockiae]MBF6173273.1 TetR/AcrR family transcriptional regulator [Nocardia blacklockiae]
MTIVERQYGGRAVADRKAERRERFLRAATRLFAERGYAGCSLADVCAGAGLSKRQFYEEFETREDVLAAAYDRIQDEAAAAVTRALAAAGAETDARAALTVVLTAYLESIDSDPYRAKVAFIEVVGVSERMERHRRARRHVWAQLVELAVAPVAGPNARIRGSRALAASTLIGAVNGLAHEWLLMDPRPPVSDLTDLLVPVAVALIETGD